MNPSQFQVLYHEFLFRMVDLDLLSSEARGDMSRLFGQVASLLVWVSIGLALAGMIMGRRTPLSGEHFLISTTMLAVGLFAVLSWDSTFPSKQDAMVLGPLPVRARTLFLSKAAGVGASMAITVGALHSLSQLTWPWELASGGVVSFIRTLAAYWVTMLAAGAFVFCCVLAVQGIAAQLLPRRLFLRVSAILQTAALCVFICGYLMEPMAATPAALRAAEGTGAAAWQFSFWFLGLFQQIQGAPALGALAARAWMGFAAVVAIAAAAYGLAYFHMLRRIVEEPDIAPGVRAARRLPPFGNAFQTAVGQFSWRSLVRSRRHRLILAFYLGLGFALNFFFLSTPAARLQTGAAAGLRAVSTPFMAVTIATMLFTVAGMRIIFALPLDLKANWIFRLAPAHGGANCLKARRRALLAMGVLPVWGGFGALLFFTWPWREAATHLAVLGLVGAIVAEICLRGMQKIPFTCSYLPGKTNIHLTFAFSVLVMLQFLNWCAGLERGAMATARGTAAMLAGLCVALFCLRRFTTAQLAAEGGEIEFEDDGSPPIQRLNLAQR